MFPVQLLLVWKIYFFYLSTCNYNHLRVGDGICIPFLRRLYILTWLRCVFDSCQISWRICLTDCEIQILYSFIGLSYVASTFVILSGRHTWIIIIITEKHYEFIYRIRQGKHWIPVLKSLLHHMWIHHRSNKIFTYIET